MFNFGLLRSKKNKTVGEKRRMLEVIDTIQITISLNSNNVIEQLTKYNKYRYRFVLETFRLVLILKTKEMLYFQHMMY